MDWSLISDDSIMKEDNSQNETAVSDLDLIPTKISSINPDPVLMVTPEKPSVFKLKSRTIKPSPLVGEKPSKARVRFDLPDSVTSEEISEQNTTESSGKNTTSSSNFTDCDSTNNDNNDFATKAALYTQRNPLADITTGSFQNFDFSSSTEGMSSLSNLSDQSSKFSQIFDMGGKMLKIDGTGKQTSPLAIHKTKLPNHRKQTAVQTKIDKLTDTMDSKLNISPTSSPTQSLVEQKPKEKQIYLKKRAGLQKHDHTLKFTSEKADIPPTKLEKPKYQSSLVAGQKLQAIQNEEFNAIRAVSGKLKSDEKLQKHVDFQAAMGTNIDPEEKLFNNLVCVDVPLDDVIAASEVKRIKRPTYAKVNVCEEPNIMDMFPDNLIVEKVVLDSKCYNLPSLTTQQSPLHPVMSLYDRSLCWEHLNSY